MISTDGTKYENMVVLFYFVHFLCLLFGFVFGSAAYQNFFCYRFVVIENQTNGTRTKVSYYQAYFLTNIF